MYGIRDNENTESLEREPPENMLNMPKRPFWFCLNMFETLLNQHLVLEYDHQI